MPTEIIPRESWPGYGSSGKESWRAVSRREPCPVCGKPDNCKITLAKTAVLCGRVDNGTKPNAGGQYLHRLGDRPPGYTHPSHFKKTKPKAAPTKDWSAIAKQLHAAGRDRLGELAAELGVSREALEPLGVGRGEIDFRDGWSFPERDAAGLVIGINHRLIKPMVRDGKPTSKIQGKGGSRGLTYADNWHAADGDVYLVEGGSDTAALMTMELCVIGRPSNRGGVELLAELLKSHPGRRIVVIGENDKKTITENDKQVERWPGRAGAETTAQGLTKLLGRPVSWSLVPARYKDSRELLKAEKENARNVFLAGLVLNTVEPPPVVKYIENAEQIKPLPSWRHEMAAARIDSIGKPGIYLDRSPTGAGKTHADAKAIASVKTSLTMLPTHAQAHGLADELKKKHGIDAAVYPKLDGETCQNIKEAQQAQAHGLIVGASVCPRCRFKEDCEYQRLKKAAEDTPHVIATQCRGSVSMENLVKGKELISIHEDARNLLRPMAQCGESYLKSVQQIASKAKDLLLPRKTIDVDAYQFFDDANATATDLLNLIERTTETTEVSLTPPKRNATKQWQETAWQAIRQCDNLMPVGESLEIIAAYMRAELVSLTIRVDNPLGAGGAVQTMKSLVAVWKTDLPKRSPVWIGDATANAVEMGTLIGRPVNDCTPTGRLESQVPPVQVCQDITRGMKKTENVAAMLRGAMSLPEHRDKQRIGIIGHKPHIEALLRKRLPLLDDATRARITKAAHFGEGPERASNDWHDNCDLIVVLGTPRVPPAAVVNELIRQGKMDAARRDGRWESYRWEAKNTAGQVVQIEGSRYADEDWHAAHRGLVYATIVQAVGRGRGNLTNGVPVVLFSNEQTGFTVMDAGQMPKISREAVEAIRKLGDGISTAAVATELGVGERQARRVLTKAEEAGQVYRQTKRWYRVPDTNAKDIPLADMSGSTHSEPLVDQAQVEEAVVTIRKDSAHTLHTKAAALAAMVPGVVLACNLSPPRERAKKSQKVPMF